MSVTCGFFNSKNGDRKYDAEQLSGIFDGLISDGVFATYGKAFAVTPGNGLRVTVAQGRAWFDHVWVLNDGPLSIDIPENTSKDGYSVYAIAIDVDRRDNVRDANIVRIGLTSYHDTGYTPGSGISAVPSSISSQIVSSTDRNMYIIAYVFVEPGAKAIKGENIYYYVGKKSTAHPYCPNFVTGIIDTITTELFVARLEAGFSEKMSSSFKQFDDWFADLKSSLTNNVAANLTSRMSTLESLVANYAFSTAEMHRNTYRGKYLGNAITDTQLVSIKDGSFTDLYVGDYWSIGGYTWRIVDIDYWYKTGDTACMNHHLVIMPDTNPYASKMNNTAISSTGYALSDFRTNMIPTITNDVQSLFGDIVLMHREYLSNAASDGVITSGAWYDSFAEIPNEIMIFGTHITSAASTSSTLCKRVTVDKTQLALFRLVPSFVISSGFYWLRDIVSGTHFSVVTPTGLADYGTVTNNVGIRPVFAIG